jgi:O-antigen/teichoic acid export membrane protein
MDICLVGGVRPRHQRRPPAARWLCRGPRFGLVCDRGADRRRDRERNTRFSSTVSLPTLSEIARTDPSRLREVYYKLRLPGDLLLLFMAGLLFAAGQLVIDLLYDPRYSAAGGMLRVLALSLFAVRYGVAHQIYLAVGIPRYLTVINVARFVSLYSLVPLLYYLGGIDAAIWGVALHALATVPFVYGFNARLGLNDFRRELMFLVALPVGFLCGSVLNLLLG